MDRPERGCDEPTRSGEARPQLVARTRRRADQNLSCSDSLNQFLAGFEEGNLLRWHVDSGSRFWIACNARSSLARVETSESANFNLVAGSQRADDAVKYGANNDVGFLHGQLNGLANPFGQIRSGHLVHPSLHHEAE